MSVEHNFVEEKRSAIEALISENGYSKLPIYDSISGVDDWYASEEVAKTFYSLWG